jgi:hypothetical protein
MESADRACQAAQGREVTDPALSQFIGVLREAAAAMRIASGRAGLPRVSSTATAVIVWRAIMASVRGRTAGARRTNEARLRSTSAAQPGQELAHA